LDTAQLQEKMLPFLAAGATCWIEELIGGSEEAIIDRIRLGPPLLE
jgi:hypothetical protein